MSASVLSNPGELVLLGLLLIFSQVGLAGPCFASPTRRVRRDCSTRRINPPITVWALKYWIAGENAFTKHH